MTAGGPFGRGRESDTVRRVHGSRLRTRGGRRPAPNCGYILSLISAFGRRTRPRLCLASAGEIAELCTAASPLPRATPLFPLPRFYQCVPDRAVLQLRENLLQIQESNFESPLDGEPKFVGEEFLYSRNDDKSTKNVERLMIPRR